MNISSTDAPRRTRGRLFLLLGPALAVLGIVGYILQMSFQRLVAPWYMPCLATLGVALVVVALWERRSFWRVLTLVAVILLASAEWAFLLAMRLPSYMGPVAVGRTFPVFATLRADGTPFTQHDLASDQNSLLVFFRGRW